MHYYNPPSLYYSSIQNRPRRGPRCSLRVDAPSRRAAVLPVDRAARVQTAAGFMVLLRLAGLWYPDLPLPVGPVEQDNIARGSPDMGANRRQRHVRRYQLVLLVGGNETV